MVDFINFGVVPGFIIYAWVNSFEDIRGLDWALVLFFAVCGAIRLARFNVELSQKSVNPILEKYFFILENYEALFKTKIITRLFVFFTILFPHLCIINTIKIKIKKLNLVWKG